MMKRTDTETESTVNQKKEKVQPLDMIETVAYHPKGTLKTIQVRPMQTKMTGRDYIKKSTKETD